MVCVQFRDTKMGSIHLCFNTSKIAELQSQVSKCSTDESTERVLRRTESLSKSLYMEMDSSGTYGSTTRGPATIALSSPLGIPALAFEL